MAGELAFAVDLGGTQVRAGLVEDGRVLRRASTLTDVRGGAGAVLEQMVALFAEVCGPADRERLAGVGVSAPGPLDGDRGVVLHIPTLPHLDGFALRDSLAAELGLPVTVENDGIAAAVGEWRHGAGRGLRHLVYVTVSTGVGGGVIVDGHVMRGRLGMAGHVGHMRLATEGPRCACGAVGCLEALASGTALGARARAAARADPTGALGRAGDPGEIEARHVVELARRGDPTCLGLLREEASYLGAGFTTLLHLYSPELLIMGGGVASALDLMAEDIREVIRRDALEPFRNVAVVRAVLGENSGLVGAAVLALEQRGLFGG
ncbi:MAG TPA: ROK family protein [Anaeromyxobacter sp.]|nr:ROK family protein [Anaeromyxobacter sp.]